MKGVINMKIGVYDIINDPLPQLYKIKDIVVNKNDFQYDKNIVNVMNTQLMMNKLDSEHIYALSLTYGLIPRGIIQISVGTCEESIVDIRELAIGLLLTGAEQFMCFHNHPGGNKNVSEEDKLLTKQYNIIGNFLGINFIKHIMITQNYYCECKEG